MLVAKVKISGSEIGTDIKRVTRKFHVTVLQTTGKKSTKKCAARAKLLFCVVAFFGYLDLFFHRSLCG